MKLVIVSEVVGGVVRYKSASGSPSKTFKFHNGLVIDDAGGEFDLRCFTQSYRFGKVGIGPAHAKLIRAGSFLRVYDQAGMTRLDIKIHGRQAGKRSTFVPVVCRIETTPPIDDTYEGEIPRSTALRWRTERDALREQSKELFNMMSIVLGTLGRESAAAENIANAALKNLYKLTKAKTKAYPEIGIVAAFDLAGGMGYKGGLPWNIPEDLKYFKSVTEGHTVIMGRKTYESIGRLLPNRKNIIISSGEGDGKGIWCKSLLEAFSHVDGKGFVIGGAELFREALPFAEVIHTTVIHSTCKADVFFPVATLEEMLSSQPWEGSGENIVLSGGSAETTSMTRTAWTRKLDKHE
ncbi:MAG: dihydrofolate reductase [Shewanella sp.]